MRPARRPPRLAVALLAAAALVAIAAVAHAARAGRGAARAPPAGAAVVFSRGDGGYSCVKIPSVTRLAGGALLALGEGRRGSCADDAPTDVVARRSSDGGRSWGALRVAVGGGAAAQPASSTWGNAAPVVLPSGALLLPLCRNNAEVWLSRSDDGGASFAPPVRLEGVVDPAWRWVGLGPPAGLLLRSGRVLVPLYRSAHRLDGTVTAGAAMLSDDGGASWRLGAAVGGAEHWVNEGQAAELASGEVLLNARGAGVFRLQAASRDGGESFGAVSDVPSLGAPVDGCEGSLLALPPGACGGAGGAQRVLYSGPSGPSVLRRDMRLHASDDGGATYSELATIDGGAVGYSSLALLGANATGAAPRAGLLYERSDEWRLVFEPDAILFVPLGPDVLCARPRPAAAAA